MLSGGGNDFKASEEGKLVKHLWDREFDQQQSKFIRIIIFNNLKKFIIIYWVMFNHRKAKGKMWKAWFMVGEIEQTTKKMWTINILFIFKFIYIIYFLRDQNSETVNIRGFIRGTKRQPACWKGLTKT